MKKMLSLYVILACLSFFNTCYDDGSDTPDPVVDDSCADVDMPVFICPEAGSYEKLLPLGLKISAFDVEFQVEHESEIVRVENAQRVNNDTYVTQCGKECLDNFKSSETIIEVQDACGNKNSITLTCEAQLSGCCEIYGWPWLMFIVYYHYE
ncbi:MAG TPA: hypothetical protein PKY31_15765 [Spirochaetota bacterium]|nr:hypothetical protein [Spirochaetota bacterium]